MRACMFYTRGTQLETQKVHSPNFHSVQGPEQWRSKSKNITPTKTFELCTKGDVVWPYLCERWHFFCGLNLGIKGVKARRRHWCKCSLVSVLLYLFFTIFMVEKADSQQYVEVCTLLLCGWSNYYTACCLVWLQMVYFSAPYLRVLRVFLFEVCMLCFIVTFHVTTFDKGNRLVAD